MDSRKILVLATSIVFILIAIAIAVLRPNQPTIVGVSLLFGDPKSNVEVVIFEDFKCYGCRAFSNQTLPRIEKEYLATEQIRLKIIPLGFLRQSKVLANAALEVYQLAPQKFLSYANLVFERFGNEEINDSAEIILLELAEQVGGIDLNQLKVCMGKKCHYPELDRNLEHAKTLMGNRFRIPALYVNGARVNTTDYQAIQREIEKALK